MTVKIKVVNKKNIKIHINGIMCTIAYFFI